jgi:hypothetical protein
VLPELDRAASAATRPALARAAGLAREDTEWLDEQADRCFVELAVRGTDGLQLDVTKLGEMPAPILRRVLLLAIRNTAGSREVGLEHVEAVRAVMMGTCGGVDVPGARVELLRGKLVLLQQKAGAK